MTPNQRIAEVAASQHAAFTAKQARAAGFTRRMIERQLAIGRWVARRRGTFTVAGTRRTWEQDVFVAVLAYGPRAVASHTTAAALLGLLETHEGAIHVTMPAAQHRRHRPGIKTHRTTLRRSDVVTREDIRCTSANRTLVDIAGLVPRPSLEASVDAAIIAGLTSARAAARYIRERNLTHNRGGGVLVEVLSTRIPGARDSGMERIFEDKLRRAGLPMPVPQYPFDGYKIDFAYPDAKIAIELDSLGFHLSREAFIKDRKRQNELVLAGWLPLRFTWWDVADGWPATEQTLRTALA